MKEENTKDPIDSRSPDAQMEDYGMELAIATVERHIREKASLEEVKK